MKVSESIIGVAETRGAGVVDRPAFYLQHDDTHVKLVFSYDAALVELLKSTIDSKHRAWIGDAKFWTVDVSSPTLKAFLNDKYFCVLLLAVRFRCVYVCVFECAAPRSAFAIGDDAAAILK